jgi:DNA-binding response OmpR family regulator
VNRSIRVLIVDDEETLRTHLTAYLEDAGFEVTAVADGETALDMLARDPTDVALVDIRLPGVDGNAVIEEGCAICPGVKFLIHTASPSYTPPPAVARCGVDERHILVKPVLDLEVMVEAIRRRAGDGARISGSANGTPGHAPV